MKLLYLMAAGALLIGPAQSHGSKTAPQAADAADETLDAVVEIDDLDRSAKRPARHALLPTAPLTKDEIEQYGWTDHLQTSELEPVEAWLRALEKKFSPKAPDSVALGLARGSGFSSVDMRTLIRLWVRSQTRDFRRPIPGGDDALRHSFLDLVERTQRSPLVLGVAAKAFEEMARCRPEDFDALMRGSTNPAEDAFNLATAAYCAEGFTKAAALAPARTVAPVLRIVGTSELTPAANLTLYEWLTSPAALEHVAPADRTNLSTWLAMRQADQLFDLGLNDRAMRLIESLPAEQRERALSGEPWKFTAVVDGRNLKFDDSSGKFLKQELAAAYALAGRRQEAEALLKSIPGFADARRKFHCDWNEGAGKDKACSGNRDTPPMDLLILDQFLNRPGDDPYPLAEVIFATSISEQSPSGATAELRCRVFKEPDFGGICDQAHWSVAYNIKDRLDQQQMAASPRIEAQLAPLIPGFTSRRDELTRVLDRRATELDHVDQGGRSESVPAPQSPFAELPVPKALRGPTPKKAAWPKDVAPLPDGFDAVRFERSGDRAVAISLSTAYDPTGEVSAGGYWVHLSEDGGKHWSATYYTGLAQYFPYVVKAASRLPLIAGDALNVEVEVAEIDTASISYPPIGVVTRRRASGIYLKLPLAELARDSDSDGFTDIAEKHLLLDRYRGEGGTPFIVGTDPQKTCGPVAPEKLALIAMLGRLLRVQARAIVEPVDRPAGLVIGKWTQGTAPGDSTPIFLSGDPKDFYCLDPNRLMIVYSGKDIEELERFTPDFHTLSLPSIVFNREHDRGYVKYSFGWAGGTLRLRLVKGQWVFDELSNWIT